MRLIVPTGPLLGLGEFATPPPGRVWHHQSMAAHEIVITHPKRPKPLRVLRSAFDAGKYPGFTEVKPAKPAGAPTKKEDS